MCSHCLWIILATVAWMLLFSVLGVTFGVVMLTQEKHGTKEDKDKDIAFLVMFAIFFITFASFLIGLVRMARKWRQNQRMDSLRLWYDRVE